MGQKCGDIESNYVAAISLSNNKNNKKKKKEEEKANSLSLMEACPSSVMTLDPTK